MYAFSWRIPNGNPREAGNWFPSPPKALLTDDHDRKVRTALGDDLVPLQCAITRQRNRHDILVTVRAHLVGEVGNTNAIGSRGRGREGHFERGRWGAARRVAKTTATATATTGTATKGFLGQNRFTRTQALFGSACDVASSNPDAAPIRARFNSQAWRANAWERLSRQMGGMWTTFCSKCINTFDSDAEPEARTGSPQCAALL